MTHDSTISDSIQTRLNSIIAHPPHSHPLISSRTWKQWIDTCGNDPPNILLTYFLIPPPGAPPDKQNDVQRCGRIAGRHVHTFGSCTFPSMRRVLLSETRSCVPLSLAAFIKASSAFFLSLKALSSSSSSFFSFLAAFKGFSFPPCRDIQTLLILLCPQLAFKAT
ncbi:hypothetical protein L210DRAFT_645526 [Boletus edulis BED1]|uniref:Uncharacterized protein n=1 Tax=Boletus edulis BED1 TaxID=1328754 RepID=A0AAD4BID5_BOLED|nr:hypothetical protein L210DRAFT_645526 [Boletus edulis BED1]